MALRPLWALLLATAPLLPLTSVGNATVTPVSRFRQVQTFATISGVDGGDGTSGGETINHEDSGIFERSLETRVEDPEGSTVLALASQSSNMLEEFIQASGAFSAEARLEGDTQFAEGLGFSRVTYSFDTDAATPYRIEGLLAAAGGGRTSIRLIWLGSAVLIDQTVTGEDREVRFEGTLDPGRYQFDVWTFGFGQAIAPDDNRPASGAFDFILNLSSDPAGVAEAVPGQPAIGIRPVPARPGETLLLEQIPPSARHVGIYDARGRAIRSFGPVLPARMTWDMRDERGVPVSAGLYFVRVDGSPSGKAVVLR